MPSFVVVKVSLSKKKHMISAQFNHTKSLRKDTLKQSIIKHFFSIPKKYIKILKVGHSKHTDLNRHYNVVVGLGPFQSCNIAA